MPTYTVHAPPPRQDETTSAPERFVFVRDGFHFWAFLFAPLWLLLHGLWLALVIYVVGYGVVIGGLAFLHASANVQFLVGLLTALLIGFEASSIWRLTLARRGWTTLGFVVGEDTEIAEQRFFSEWTRRAAPRSPPPSSVETGYTAPVRRGPPSPSDVIGLFPEPGAQR
jgi:hypothetical protein